MTLIRKTALYLGVAYLLAVVSTASARDREDHVTTERDRTIVEAPATSVTADRRRTRVDAPFTDVDVDRDRRRVRIDVPGFQGTIRW